MNASNFPLTLTDAAIARVADVLQHTAEPKAAFRVQVLAGGCSGFKYIFELTDTIEADDATYQNGTAIVVVDPSSRDLLQGSILDFSEDLSGAEFVVRNPNATGGCGCGTSFSI